MDYGKLKAFEPHDKGYRSFKLHQITGLPICQSLRLSMHNNGQKKKISPLLLYNNTPYGNDRTTKATRSVPTRSDRRFC